MGAYVIFYAQQRVCLLAKCLTEMGMRLHKSNEVAANVHQADGLSAKHSNIF